MNEYFCKKCDNIENFKTLEHPANEGTKAVMCCECGFIWLSEYPIENK